ncbi:hypothetical protein BASA81_000769 [Batrachochytrium salamandrivorans]|nr:hypothetical protein BASA81_000739 [Batrachochytrium salamandrivorans]KAH9261065.1 hypothetical protein BASA81_000769 [Batrachochytrium salamandrivorans]
MQPLNQAEAFEMVEARFVAPLPAEELGCNERLFAHLEQAWWFYEDSLCDNFKHLPHIRRFEPFARQFVQWSRCFPPEAKLRFEDNYLAYREYQHRIPVHGAALLSADLRKVLLVSGYASHTWGFPKGKINQNEDAVDCALREVYEETGFPALEYFRGKRDYEWMHWNHRTNGKDMHLLIVPDVPEDFAFAPRVVKEIADIRWFALADLPAHEKAGVALAGGDRVKLWGVSAFLPQLREWIARRQGRQRRRKARAPPLPATTAPAAAAAGFAVDAARLRLAMQVV